MIGAVHHGDNLALLGEVDRASIDLVYADGPFFTQRDWGAFDDRWASRDAYIAWMRARVCEIHRVLKPTGSFYLHCDPTASHYLRLMVDEVFDPRGFRGAVAWKRTSAHSKAGRRYGAVHDTILHYARGPAATFHQLLDADGEPVGDLWLDITLSPSAKERTSYPTQKPVALAERIIAASTDPGDVVLDPFCGSGTTLVAAQRLARRWIGFDSSPEAVATARDRLGVSDRGEVAA